MVRKWKTVRVFISSTFRDTHFERDALTRLVFPELREWCEKRYLHITEVDLRWGVTQEESAAGKAIEICLDEIDRSDLFLCLIGSRYGWVPEAYEVGNEDRFAWVRDQQGLSITELEIMRGALNPPETQAKNVSHALFYFRDEGFLKDLEDKPKKLCEFTDGHTEFKSAQLQYIPDKEKRKKLLALKDRILHHAPDSEANGIKFIIHDNYESLYNVEQSLSGMNEAVLRRFCSMVLTDLKEAINDRYPIDVMDKATNVEQMAIEQSYQLAYMEYRLSQFRDRPDLVERVRTYAESNVVAGPLLVTAGSGMGKSSVISKALADIDMDIARQKELTAAASASAAKLAATFTGADPDKDRVKPVVVLRYFAGASPGSLQVHNMLRTLLLELRKSLRKHRPKKRTEQLWDLVRASLRIGNAVGTTLAGKMNERDNVRHGKKAQPTRRHKITSDVPSSYPDLAEEFKRTLIEVCDFARVVLVLDNLDHIVRDKNQAMTLCWLPHDLPRSLRLIVGVDENRTTFQPHLLKRGPGEKTFRRPSSPMSDSGVDYRKNRPAVRLDCARSASGAADMQVPQHGLANASRMDKFDSRSFIESFHLHFKEHEQVDIPGLSRELAEQVICDRLGQYGKKLSTQQMGILLNKANSDNPSWIVIACEELRVFTQYERVTERILELADDLPALLEQMIRRLERDHGPRFVRDALSILVCARDGLFENEIVGILGVPLSAWSQLYYSIKPLLSNITREGDGLISFSHRNFTLAILKRYFSDGTINFQELMEKQERAQLQQHSTYAVPIHARLALYFKSAACDRNTDVWSSENGRALTCLPYHLLHGKMYRTLESTLTDLQFIEALLASGSGFSWIDDLSSALTTFERFLAVVQNQLSSPGLGLDLGSGLDVLEAEELLLAKQVEELMVQQQEAAANGVQPALMPHQLPSQEATVTEEMVRRIRDYYAFAQAYTPELNANPMLVFQYASNLPDINTAAQSAKRFWNKSQDSRSRRPWLRWINKPQESGPCMMTLCGHTGAVLHCDVSRDEKRVVSGSADRTVRVWVAQTGESPLVLEGHKDAITCVCFSPVNSDVIVSSSRDGTARVYIKGVCARLFEGHGKSPLLACTVSECGNWVATGDQSGRLMIWDIFADEAAIQDFRNFHGGITMLRFSFDGQFIFAAGDDRTVRGWNLSDGTQYMCKSGDAMSLSTVIADSREKVIYVLRTSAMRIKIFDGKRANRALSQASAIVPVQDIEGVTTELGSMTALDPVLVPTVDLNVAQHSDGEPSPDLRQDPGEEETEQDGRNEAKADDKDEDCNGEDEDEDEDEDECEEEGGDDARIDAKDAAEQLAEHLAKVQHQALDQSGEEEEAKQGQGTDHATREHGGLILDPVPQSPVAMGKNSARLSIETIYSDREREMERHLSKQNSKRAVKGTGRSDTRQLPLERQPLSAQLEQKKRSAVMGSVGSDDAADYEEDDVAEPGDDYDSQPEQPLDHPRVNLKEIPRCTLRENGANMVSSCALSLTKRVATGRADGSIAVFHAESGRKLCKLHGHIGRINHVAYSLSGQRLVSASSDCTVKIWNPRRARLRSNTPHKAAVTKCTFNQDAKCLSLLTISREGQVSLWNAANGYRTSLNASEDPLQDAQFTRQGKTYVTISSTVRIFSTTGDGRSWMVPQANVGLWDLSPCGKIFVCVEAGGFDIQVWGLQYNPVRKIRTVTKAHEKKITVTKFSNDGALLYTAGTDGKIRAWDTLKLAQEMHLPSQLLNVQTQKALDTAESGTSSHNLGVTPDHAVFPLLTMHDPKDLGLASLIHSVFESPDGRLLLSISDSPDIKLWDLVQGLDQVANNMPGTNVTGVYGHSNRVTCVAWAPHGYSFASGSVNGTIRLWDTLTQDCSTIISGHTSSVVDLKFMPDGRRVVSISSDKTLCLWSAISGDQVNSMVFGSPLSAMAVSSSGRYIAVGDMKGDMRILEAMNPFLGTDVEVKQIKGTEETGEEASAFENEEFPFVCPTKVLHMTIKGPKKWDQRCQLRCAYCMRFFALSGNMMKQVIKVEHNTEMQGFSEQALRDLRLLNRCVHCRKIVRVTPFRLDRSRMLAKVLWKERSVRQKLKPLSQSDMKALKEHLQEKQVGSRTFYDPNSSEKMTPFHVRKKTALPGLSVSTKKTDEALGSHHDLMTRHLHALSLKAQNTKQYRTFRSGKDSRESALSAGEASFVKAHRKRQARKKAQSMLLSNNSLMQNPRVASPHWLVSFSKMEAGERLRRESLMSASHAQQQQGGRKELRAATAATAGNPSGFGGGRGLTASRDRLPSSGTMVACDDEFLEKEGPFIRRCNTASDGVRRRKVGDPKAFKVLKSTCDLRLPENMYNIMHGLPRGSQLETINKVNPVALRISPDVVDFGILCEHSVYRYPVELLNCSANLMRFRCAVDLSEESLPGVDTVDRTETPSNVARKSGCPTPKHGPKLQPTASKPDVTSLLEEEMETCEDNTLTVIQPPGSNPLVHGLQAAIFLELRTHHPAELAGTLRISTSTGHLYSTPIIATVASKADFASSQRRSRAVNKEDITNRNVIHVHTSLNNI